MCQFEYFLFYVSDSLWDAQVGDLCLVPLTDTGLSEGDVNQGLEVLSDSGLVTESLVYKENQYVVLHKIAQ